MKEMKYLGTMIGSDGNMDSEVEQRMEWHQGWSGQLEAQCWEGRSYRRGQN